MSYAFDFDLKNKIIRCRIEGLVTDEALTRFYDDVAKLGAERPTFSGLFDMSAVTSLQVTSDAIRALARRPPAIPDPNVPRIILAGSAEMFGMARMFDLQGSETRPNLHVVRNEKEAFAILGVTAPRFEPA